MAKRVRYLVQIVPHLEERYDATRVQAIMQRALARYDVLLEEHAGEPKACHMHTRERIYPAIAMFDAMTAEGIERAEVADFLTGYYTWRAGGMARMVKRVFKIPGLYRAVPKVFSAMAKKSFGPRAGFASEGAYLSKEEVRFDMVRCPYMDTCVRYGCPEIVRGFCDADDVCYGDMHPKVSWERTKTMGYGHDCCDFKVRIRQRQGSDDSAHAKRSLPRRRHPPMKRYVPERMVATSRTPSMSCPPTCRKTST